jgi:threonyl-tRNA synthetase
MINITFPDGSIRQYHKYTTGRDVAKSISVELLKSSVMMYLDGKLTELNTEIESDSTIKLLSFKDHECIEILHHSSAHLLAHALTELFPNVKLAIGPATDTGFYYDLDNEKPLTLDDLEKIEDRMLEISRRNYPIKRLVRKIDFGYLLFLHNPYKTEILDGIDGSEEITIYNQGNFSDLCRGPHLPFTSFIKHFKLTKLAGAYWRGDSNNKMLQRIYGVVFPTKEELDAYLYMVEEAKKRDHRKLGQQMNLFHFQDEAAGMVFWHNNGWNIYKTIEQYIRKQILRNGYIEVKTPVLIERSLWEASGHWEKFHENMFTLENDDKTLALKPMNCPCHVQIFKQNIKSYRDLPLRMSEFGLCHRNEPSGALHGLMRVRGFRQDDAHIFCTEDQITSETIEFSKLLIKIYKDFGFEKIVVKFSDRPKVRAGSDEIWDKAENALKNATHDAGLSYVLSQGEGAFYGPKLEFCLKDSIGREWQCGTLQVDFVLPERLDANYINNQGEKKRPVMVHRAIIGSFERFIGILIEEYEGRFPLWLAPIQIAITTITSDLDEYATNLYKEMISENIRAELYLSSDKITYKIRELSNRKIPLIAVIGKKEIQDNTVTIRRLGSDQQENIKIFDLIDMVKSENKKYF